MDGMTNIEKTKEDLERCKQIVQQEVGEIEVSLLDTITKEIMDTALFMGGDFASDNIQVITKEYIKNGGIERLKSRYQGR